jgi:hypothetical protein
MASTTAAFVPSPVRTATIHKTSASASIHQPSTTVATMPNTNTLTNTFDRNTSHNHNHNHNHQRRMSSSRMTMNMVAGNGAATVMGIVSGGILGGALHAIAGEFWECGN